MIYFTPKETCEATIIIQAPGLYESVGLLVKSAIPAETVRGKIKLSLVKANRTHVEVEFTDEYLGPIELSAVKEVIRES